MATAHAEHHGEVDVNAGVYGLIAEFDSPDALVAASHVTKDTGYYHFETYAPFPIHGLSEAMGFKDWRLPKFAFFGGIAGMLTGMLGLYYVNVIDYPLNVGGKPLFSWTQFIPVTYECTILFAAGTAFLSQFMLNGLPKPYHPIFNAKNFDRASQDRFFLFIETTDPIYNAKETADFLRSLDGVLNVSEVEKD
jgi:hypothetical protein